MLVSKLITSTLELQGFRVESVEKLAEEIVVRIVPDRRFKPVCSHCGGAGRHRDTRGDRRFKHVPLWGMAVVLLYAPRRVWCPACRGVHVERLPWAAGKRRQTKALAIFLATWAKELPWSRVAALFRCSWGTVASAVGYVVEYGLANRNIDGVRLIGVDEISRKRGHVYLTNVYDLEQRTLLWSGEGRTKATLEEFFRFLGPERAAGLEGVCCDMWQPYVDVVMANAPNATLVFDKFHIVRHLMEAVDEVRRQEINEKGKEHRDLVAKTRYLWLKNPWNLTDRQKSKLGVLEKLNLKINRAYLLKEAFRRFWSYRLLPWAEKYLQKWFWWATHSRLEPMRKFAWLVRRHERGILAYFKLRITNASVEGLNNKAKVVSHRAYGFRTARTFITNLYLSMGNLPMPESTHRFV
jgi:transposase